MTTDGTLREGDRVTGSGVVRDGAIVWDGESVAVEAPALSIGDRVSWHRPGAVEREFGSTEWHPGEQLLFSAFDVDKGARRTFAMAGVRAWGRPQVEAALAAEHAAPLGLDLAALRAANLARQAEWCPDQVPDLSFRGNELAGEGGEAMEAALDFLGAMGRMVAAIGRAANTIKKLERERHGWAGSRATKAQLAEELADVVICADLCGITADIPLAPAVVAKFNTTSEKV